jgi:ABC-type Fe3+ transport system permease subunit
MGALSWPVRFFDKHAGGLAAIESLRLSLEPLALQVAVLLPCAAVVWLNRSGAERQLPGCSRGDAVFSWVWVVVAMLALLVAPVAYVSPTGTPLPALVQQLAEQSTFWTRLGYSLMFGAAAALCTYLLAGALRSGCKAGGIGGGASAVLTLVLCVIGLCGPLLLSLAVLSALSRPRLASLRDSPVPLMVVRVVLLLPLAVVLLYVADRGRDRESICSGRLLLQASASRVRRAGGRILWRLQARPRAAVLFLLFCWGYWELVAGDLLAPVTMQLAPALLYNKMHYGGTASLSALVLVFFALPLALLAAAGLIRRAYVLVLSHG